MSSTAELKATIAELQERLKVETERDKLRDELVAFLKARPLLTFKDVVAVGNAMKPEREVEPVHTHKIKRGGKWTEGAKHVELGAQLRAAREAKGLTTTTVADKLGCHNSSISQWEHGVGKPSDERMAKMAKLYGTSLKALANGHAP